MVLAPGKVALEIQDVADVGAAPAVNGLILVAHDSHVAAESQHRAGSALQVVCRSGGFRRTCCIFVLRCVGEISRGRQQAHQLILAAVGVLIFVHHQEFVAAIELLARKPIVRQQADGFEQQVVEIQGVRFQQAGLVPFVDDRQTSGDRIGGGAGQVLGGLFVALGVADAGERGPVRQKFFVQAELLVNRFQNRKLVVVVIDREQGGEAAADLGQRRALAPKEAHTERMERSHVGQGIDAGDVRGDQRLHPVAHFARGFVGEGDGQNGPARHAMGGHQMGHPMGNDSRFAASGAGQHQQRPLDMGHGLLLAGIEAF